MLTVTKNGQYFSKTITCEYSDFPQFSATAICRNVVSYLFSYHFSLLSLPSLSLTIAHNLTTYNNCPIFRYFKHFNASQKTNEMKDKPNTYMEEEDLGYKVSFRFSSAILILANSSWPEWVCATKVIC